MCLFLKMQWPMWQLVTLAVATSTLSLGKKVKRDKLAAFYKHLNVTGDIDLISLD